MFNINLTHYCICIHQAVEYPQRRYRIILRSTMGPIDVYLVRYYCLVFEAEISAYAGLLPIFPLSQQLIFDP